MTLPSFRKTSLRNCIAALTLLVAAGFARTAAAQIGTGTGGSTGTTTTTTFTAADFLIAIQAPKGAALLDFDLQRFFNIANCNCDTPVFPFFTFSQSGLAKLSSLPEGTIQFLVGYQCDSSVVATNCVKIGPDLPLSTFALNGGVTLTSSAQALSTYFGQPVVSTAIEEDGGIVSTTTTPTMGGNICASNIAFTQFLYALITFTGSGNLFDIDVNTQLSIDLNPPPVPTNFVVEPGNEALIGSWTGIDTVGTPDFLGYQMLCDRGGALQVFKPGTFSPQFHTCPGMLPTTGVDQNINGLDETFTCSGLLTSGTNSDRIKILQNGVTYGVAVVAIDQHYNASPPMVVYGVPIKTLSFYDVYRNGDSQVQPGEASGGFCAVRAGPIRMSGRATLASLGGLAVGVVLVGLRRRRRRRP